MKMKTYRQIPILMVMLVATGCFSIGGEKKSTDGLSSTGLSDSDVPGTGVLTVAIPTSTQIMPHMTALAGLTPAQVTNNTRNSFAAKAGLLSLNGDAESISGPVQLATVSLGGEYCDDILDVEVPAASAQRRFFASVNFSAGLSSLSTSARADAITAMSRRFWGRAADATEVSLLQAGLSDAFLASNQTQTAETRRMMFYLCTVMLSSVSSHSL
jgi:hypothetical protein